jgi:CheY-like chemotaxis protein
MHISKNHGKAQGNAWSSSLHSCFSRTNTLWNAKSSLGVAVGDGHQAELNLVHLQYVAREYGGQILHGRLILIVEDEPLIALHLHAALNSAGAGIVAATETAEALRLIRRNEISAAILDISLRDQDCTAVCQALLHHRIPFLFHTGHADAAVLKAWPEIRVLVKPVSDHEIIASVADLVY